MNFILRCAFKELKNNKGFSAFFVFNLALGMLGFLFFFSSLESVNGFFQDNLRRILTADVRVSTRGTPPEDLAERVNNIVGDRAISAETISMITMVKGPDLSKLVNVQAIDKNYPLYGQFELMDGEVEESDISTRLSNSIGIWMDESMLSVLGAKVGKTVKLGTTDFTVNGIVKRIPSLFTGFGGMLPTIFVSLDRIHQTGLTKFGSRINYNTFLKFLDQDNYLELSAALEALSDEDFDGADVRVQTLEESDERINSLINYISGFFSLITLLAVFLGGVGLFYLFKGFAQKRIKSTAIMKCLGLSNKDTYLITICQLVILSFVSCLIAYALNIILLVGVVENFVVKYLPGFTIESNSWSIFLFSLLIAVSSSILFTLPIFIKFKDIKPVLLLNGAAGENTKTSKISSSLPYIPCLAFIWGVACVFTSLKIGTLFILVFLVALGVIVAFGYGVIFFAKKYSKNRTPLVKTALRNISRHKTATISSFAAIATGTFLMAVIPQVTNGLKEEIGTPSSKALPSLFLFDIQLDQKQPLIDLLDKHNFKLKNTSPMIAGRLVSINNVSIKDPELIEALDERARRMLERGLNISYRDELYDSESLVEGVPFDGSYSNTDKPVQISMEVDFAASLQVNIGDRMVMDVQGVELEGELVNLRRVKWNSFEPNFFFIIQSGLLEEAPHTFVSNLNVPKTEKISIQSEITHRFPNITAIDVEEIITTVLNVADKGLLVVLLLAVLAVLSGLTIVFMIALHEMRARSSELALLKILGYSSTDLRILTLLEFALPGLFSAIGGIALSTVGAIFFSKAFFDNIGTLSFDYLSLLFLIVTIILIGASLLATNKVIKEKPRELVNAD